MNSAQRDFIDGLGLAVLAALVTIALLYGTYVAIGKADYFRMSVFGILSVVALYWTVRFTRAQFAAYRASKN